MRTMCFPTRGVSEAQQDKVAEELLSWNVGFLDLTDRLYFAANQVDKYTKQWLVGKRRINMEQLEHLLQEASSAVRSAYKALSQNHIFHENNM